MSSEFFAFCLIALMQLLAFFACDCRVRWQLQRDFAAKRSVTPPNMTVVFVDLSSKKKRKIKKDAGSYVK